MIQPQFLNLVNSSFLLWMDDHILTKGSGYTDVPCQFYSVGRRYNGLYTYASPYQPFVANENIAPASTGIYIGNSFCQRGESGFVDFNYNRGQAYFDSKPSAVVSGLFSVKDINVLPLNVSEEKLLFETKFNPRSETSQNVTGLPTNAYSYPAIYVKSEMGKNKEFAFGGTDISEIRIGVFMFCDSRYQLDALKSIMQDSAHEHVPLLTVDKFPFNIYGGFKETGSNFNYETETMNVNRNGSGLYVKDVSVSSFDREFVLDFNKLNPQVHWAIADFVLERPRAPRGLNNL